MQLLPGESRGTERIDKVNILWSTKKAGASPPRPFLFPDGSGKIRQRAARRVPGFTQAAVASPAPARTKQVWPLDLICWHSALAPPRS